MVRTNLPTGNRTLAIHAVINYLSDQAASVLVILNENNICGECKYINTTCFLDNATVKPSDRPNFSGGETDSCAHYTTASQCLIKGWWT